MSPFQRTRPSLLVRLRHRDENAWREFDAAYSDLIVRYCRRCGLQLADAEDVRQLVLAKLSRSLQTFAYDPGRGRFRDYLRKCVRNAINSFASRHNPPAASVSMIEGGLADDASDPTWDEEWIQHHYRRALQTLRATTETRTLAVFDQLLCGADPATVAERFATTEENVRKIKQRMRDRLQQTIERQLIDEDAGEDPS
jgi:RNA polymerase sigma-70 factor (ECF subfamily)